MWRDGVASRREMLRVLSQKLVVLSAKVLVCRGRGEIMGNVFETKQPSSVLLSFVEKG